MTRIVKAEQINMTDDGDDDGRAETHINDNGGIEKHDDDDDDDEDDGERDEQDKDDDDDDNAWCKICKGAPQGSTHIGTRDPKTEKQRPSTTGRAC